MKYERRFSDIVEAEQIPPDYTAAVAVPEWWESPVPTVMDLKDAVVSE